jgi:hypothetical protein
LVVEARIDDNDSSKVARALGFAVRIILCCACNFFEDCFNMGFVARLEVVANDGVLLPVGVDLHVDGASHHYHVFECDSCSRQVYS